jgi:hypothetical protein
MGLPQFGQNFAAACTSAPQLLQKTIYTISCSIPIKALIACGTTSLKKIVEIGLLMHSILEPLSERNLVRVSSLLNMDNASLRKRSDDPVRLQP